MGKEQEDINEREITIDESQFIDEDDKDTGDKPEKEEPSTSEKETKEETKEETSEDDSTSADSIKTEKEEPAEEGDKKEEEETEDDTRFDKHPRFQKLIQERNELAEQAKAFKELKEIVGNTENSALKNLIDADRLLKQYPKLAEKVNKDLIEFQFGNEEINNKFNEIVRKQEEFETKIVVNNIVSETNKLISSAKLKDDEEPILRELLGARVGQLNIQNEHDMPKIKALFDKTLKDIERFRRVNLASHIESKSKDKPVPTSANAGAKVIAKKESAEMEDVVGELAEGLKAMRSQ